MYSPTTALNKIIALRKRIRGIAGGTSASKTISILQWLIHYSQTSTGNKVVSVVSETMPHLRKGAMRDFKNIMLEQGYWDDNAWNKTDSTYTFEVKDKETKKLISTNIMEFFSVDQPGRVRGPRRHVLFMNEANNVDYETFDQLEVRTSEVIWLDWNPVTEFWFYLDELGNQGVIAREDVDFLILTYKDNEALDARIVEAIEKHKNNRNWWRVYGEGQLGEVEGRIYKDWQQISQLPHEARLIRRGLDFGFSNDPAALVAVYEYNGGYILDEELYRRGMANSDLADLIKSMEIETTVIADSAEPKSIEEINQHNISIIPATKGADSIDHGIKFVQSQRISVTKRSTNLMREYRSYLWQTDKDGRQTRKPQDFQNHCMDAIRYALTPEVKNSVDDVEWEMHNAENQRYLRSRGY